MSLRANFPDDHKWQADRDLVSRRRRERHLAKLRELAEEFGLEPPSIDDGYAIATAKDVSRPTAPSIDYRERFNERLPTQPASAPAFQPVRPLAEWLHREMAKSDPKPGTPSGLPISEPSPDPVALARRRKGGYGYGKIRDPENRQ